MKTDPFSETLFADLPDLPVRALLPELSSAVRSSRATVLRAAPGAGKTSLVPLAMARVLPPASGRILLLEPRRVAAVASARRMADLLGEPVGEGVGYAVRGERSCSSNTRVEVVTEGLFTKRLVNDPGLDGVSLVIFDEFHERSIHSDLALALSLELMGLRDDLSILLMSATMDVGRICEFLASSTGAPVPLLDSAGRQYPLDISYQPLQADGRPLVPYRFEDRDGLVEGTQRCIADILSGPARGRAAGPGERGTAGSRDKGTILVFLPGRAEIDALHTALSKAFPAIAILPLHGSLSFEAQKRVLEAPPDPSSTRIVLATNIAETSLTVPGVCIVVDTGLVKVNRWHSGSGLDRLTTEVEDAFSADQRAGRAGRLGPGRVVRLWDAGALTLQPRQSEILRSELSSLLLDCASLGIRDPAGLPWLDVPPSHALDEARSLLGALGAIDREGRCTPRGRVMARLGLDVRTAALVAMPLEGKGDSADLPAAILSAALLAEGSAPLSRGRDTESLDQRLDAFKLQRNSPWARRVMETAIDILGRLQSKDLGKDGAVSLKACRNILETLSFDLPAFLFPPAFPDSLARKEGEGIFRLVSGRELYVDGTFAREPWLCVLDADAGERRGRARLVMSVPEEAAKEALALLALTAESWEWRGLEVFLVQKRMVRRLELSQTKSRCPQNRLSEAFRALIDEKGLEALPWDEERELARNALERLRFFATHRNDQALSKQLSPEALPDTLSAAVAPRLSPRGPIIDGKGLAASIEEIPDWALRREYDSAVPVHFTSPAGSRHRISWIGGQPTVSLRIQECFGLASSPLILGVPLRFELLSPAQRPVQVTCDLASFWATTWQEVRKELRGRYPKHYWPEDPTLAIPTTRVRPR